MSAGAPVPPSKAKFYHLLHERGMTTEKLAALIGSGRARVVDAINDRPSQGRHTKTRLKLVLTREEQAEWGWVPRETFQPEQATQ